MIVLAEDDFNFDSYDGQEWNAYDDERYARDDYYKDDDELDSEYRQQLRQFDEDVKASYLRDNPGGFVLVDGKPVEQPQPSLDDTDSGDDYYEEGGLGFERRDDYSSSDENQTNSNSNQVEDNQQDAENEQNVDSERSYEEWQPPSESDEESTNEWQWQTEGTQFDTTSEEQQFDFSNTDISEMLFAYSILNATDSEIQAQAKAHGITSDYKNALLKLYGITASNEMVNAYFEGSEPKKETSYTFTVTSADRFEKMKELDGDEELTLYGNVAVSFTGGGESKTLKADSMIISDDSKILIAYGDISVSDESGSALQNIGANLLVFDWEDNNLTLYSAVGAMSKSSGGRGVQYYMNGDVIVFNNKTNETYFQNATLTTNRIKQNSNWQIDAHDIVMKGTGDIFLTAMFLKMGRVPILPLPALFMPGTSLVYNPAIGFSSTKGAFINTTMDIFGGFQDSSAGSDGGLASSFTSLFATDTNKNTVRKDGLLYVKDTSSEQSALDKWAENTSSHLTTFLDAYVNEGMFFGADAATTLFNKRLSLKLLTGIAYKPQAPILGYSSTTYPSFRYGVYLSGSGSFSNMSVSFDLPFTSDPEFKYTYFNRITKFSFDSLWGTEQKFPSTYSSSSETTLTPSFRFTMGTPSFLRHKALNSFSLGLDASIQMAWKPSTTNPTGEMYSYKLGEGTLPSITMSFGGTLLDFSKSGTSTTTVPRTLTKEQALELEKHLDEMSPKQRFENELLIQRALSSSETTTSNSDQPSNESSDVKEEQLPGFNYIELDLIGNEETSGITRNLDAWNASSSSKGNVPSSTVSKDTVENDENEATESSGNASSEGDNQITSEVAENTISGSDAPSNQNEEKNAEEPIDASDEESESESAKKKTPKGQLPSGYNAPTATINETKTSFMSLFDNAYVRLTYSVNEEFYNKYAATTSDERALGDETLYNKTNAAFSLTGSVFKNYFTFSQTLNSQYIYSKEEKSSNSESHNLQLTGNTSASIPFLGLSWNLGMVYYKYSRSQSDVSPDPVIVNSPAIWSRNFISSHSLAFSKSFFNNRLSLSVSTNLPPLSSSISPTIRFSMNGFSVSASHNMDGDSIAELKNKKTSGSFSYSHRYFSTSIGVVYDYTKQQQNMHFLRPFQLTESFSTTFSTSFLRFNQSLSYLGVSSSGVNHYFSGINFSLSAWSYATLNVSLSGAYNNIQVTSTNLSLTTGDIKFDLWRGRIAIGLNATANMSFNFTDVFQNQLTYSFSLLLDIKEFLSFRLSMSGANRNFYKYVGGGTGVGSFSLGLLLEDLLRSINIFNPAGLRQTNFVMSGLNFSVSHDMGDWALSFTYTTEIVQKGNKFNWTPKYTILLQWSAIPDLKVDKTIDNR